MTGWLALSDIQRRVRSLLAVLVVTAVVATTARAEAGCVDTTVAAVEVAGDAHGPQASQASQASDEGCGDRDECGDGCVDCACCHGAPGALEARSLGPVVRGPAEPHFAGPAHLAGRGRAGGIFQPPRR